MCELLALTASEPFPLGPVLQWAAALEGAGKAGHGWGVAWLRSHGEPLRLQKQAGPLAGDPTAIALHGELAISALVHLRMPSDMSTVGIPDTQPFLDRAGDMAFAHNGFLAGHHAWRPRYAATLAGQADSEVGWAHFQALLPGLGLDGALRAVFQQIGGPDGFANLLVLDRGGALQAYCANQTNRVCTLRAGIFNGFVTNLHKESIEAVQELFPEGTLALIPVGESRAIAPLPV